MNLLHNSIKTKGILLTGLIMLVLGLPLHATWLENEPVTVVQPNGDTLYLFVTGDEYYHYVHDAEGYTILQHPETGYCVYAILVDNKLVASDYVYGTITPSEKGISPRLTISDEEYYQKKQLWEQRMPRNRTESTNHGTLNNIVVFVRFNNQSEFPQSYSSINQMFNDESPGAVSVVNYFDHASWNDLHIPSCFFPAPNGDDIISYQDPHNRNYYRPKTILNPNGYDGDEEEWSRFFELLNGVCEFVNDLIPEDLEIDLQPDPHDGNVDNLVLVIRGNVDDWGSLLWPSRRAFARREDCKIHEKYVCNVNLQFANSSKFKVGTLCHETNHSLGAPDLYHNENGKYKKGKPVGKWDLQSEDDEIPQQHTAYMKMKYDKWIAEIPDITDYPGTYTLNALAGPTRENVAYKIRSSDPDQFYVLEYRNNDLLFDSYVPKKGMIIYRVNTNFNGNFNYNPPNGIYDEIYVFRLGGSSTNYNGITYPLFGDEYNGPDSAYFSAQCGRTSFNVNTDPYPFLTNGTADRSISIFDISEAGNTISFTYGYKIQVAANFDQFGTITGGGLYAYNSTCTVTATPNPGFMFAGWYKSVLGMPTTLLSTDPNYTFAVTENKNMIAKFLPAIPTTDVYQYYCWFDQDYSTVQTGSFQTTETFFALDASALSEGLHTLHVMLEDNGLSAPKTYLFLKAPVASPSSTYNYHCWFDQDYSTVQTGSFGGGGYSFALDATALNEGIHTLHVMLEGSDLSSAKTYMFLKAPVASPTSTYTYHCWFDQDYETVQTGSFGGDGYCFALDASELDNGIHFVNVMLEGDELSSAKRYLFCKKPAGGDGIYRWEYCINGQWSDAVVTTLVPTVDTLDILALLPMDPQPIRSESFEFEPNGGQPEIYAKNTVTFRFWDAENRFLDRSAVYVDETVHEPVVADWIQRNTTETIPTPSANHIHWFKLDAQAGDSLAFMSDVYCSIELFAPSGERQFKLMNAASVAFNGFRVRENGIYYLAVHDVEGNYDEVSVTYLFFREMTQETVLSAGWNWFSTYLDGDPIELLEALQEVLGDNGVSIEGPDGINENLGDGYWWGDLDCIGVTSGTMYLIVVEEDCTVELWGMPVDPSTVEITINPGYNWIGFPGTEEVEVEVALSGFEAEDGDAIEGVEGMTEYLGDGMWWGNFDTFVPGHGYVYYSESGDTRILVFQTSRSKAKAKAVSQNKTKKVEKPRFGIDDKQ